MEEKKSETKRKKIWYGLNATVTIGPGFIHKTGWGRLLIPHPPVMNWLLRKGLTENVRKTLSFTHEFGHFQSLPLGLFYMAGMIAGLFVKGYASLPMIILIFFSTFAAWEIISEILTVMSDFQFYRKCYENITIIPRVIFWLFTITFTITGWLFLFFNANT
jgi:hypothetical protein